MYKEVRSCDVCGQSYRVKKSSQKYCSKSCAGKVRIGTLSTTFRHGMNMQGYRVVFDDGRRIMEHRLAMERHLGRRLTSNEIVHHKDENKLNNSIDNLEVTTRAGHKDLHHSKTFRSATHKQCTKCGDIKPRSEFHKKNLPGRDSHRPACKACDAKYDHARHAAGLTSERKRRAAGQRLIAGKWVGEGHARAP